MAQKMLIDATHAEETRVVVVDGNKLEEFDFETASRRQLAGNIYLAKVTRVEPSLQAAFVDYGGNRHGFLAFNEIHPDYYQIPAADRAALLEEERALSVDADDDDARPASRPAPKGETGKRVQRTSSRRRPAAQAERTNPADQVESRDISSMDIVDADGDADQELIEGFGGAEAADVAPVVETGSEAVAPEAPAVDDADAAEGDVQAAVEDEREEPYRAADHATEIDDRIESVSDGEQAEEMRPRRKPRMRRYKIQEVVKVRQIMLVQVVKEERGNKGAALTTYLSLAGRYCVLMPNTARGGGISRKITNASDRQKLKAIANEIKVPEGAGLIIRTAGAQRTKAEIKRDYEYLLRLWEQIRELTLKSIAPTPIYAEGDLIKRSIRDLYSKNIDEVLVEGEAGYRVAKDFMKMIMPSHAKNVKPYTDPMPLFARYQVETTLAAMFNPTVQLPSGGYIVIGITEALVAIDINSGRATREGSIEETALKTNLEAAAEIARQLRLRDLAGLIVIDFIDMEERKNNAAVEKMLKDKLKNDRARIQVGRISGFGLLEMSRQRLRPGMLEATTQPCPHCHGTGLIRSDDSMGLTVLRQIEEEGTRKRSREVLVRAPAAVVNFIINHKREHLAQIELRYGMAVRLEADPHMVSPDFEIEKFKTATRVPVTVSEVVSISTTLMPDLEEDEDDLIDLEAEAEDEADAPAGQAGATGQAGQGGAAGHAGAGDGEGGPRKKRRRRRRRRGGAAVNGGSDAEAVEISDDAEDGSEPAAIAETPEPAANLEVSEPDTAAASEPASGAEEAVAASESVEAPAKPAPRRRVRKPAAKKAAQAEEQMPDPVADDMAGDGVGGAVAAPVSDAAGPAGAVSEADAPDALPEAAPVAKKAPARPRRKPAAKAAPVVTPEAAPVVEAEVAPVVEAAAEVAGEPAASEGASDVQEPEAQGAAPVTDQADEAVSAPEAAPEATSGAASDAGPTPAPEGAQAQQDAEADTPEAEAPVGADAEGAAENAPKRSGWWSARS